MSSTTASPAAAPPPILPLYNWKLLSPSAQLLYLETETDTNNAVLLLETDVVGFDLEWKPNYSKYRPENPVALVQIANNDYILLIHVSRMREFPKKLQEYLQNPDIMKAGVGIQKDATKLFRDFRVSMRSCVDLALLARSVDNATWKGRYTDPIGLARLVQTYECFAMDKGKVRRSNWEKKLTPNQRYYAGNDAHAGFVLYTRLEAMKNMMTTAPRKEYYMYDCVKGSICHSSGAPWAPHNPDYDPGPPKVKKPYLDSSAAPTDLNARPESPVSPESSSQIAEIGDHQLAVVTGSLVQQQPSNNSTILPISEDGNEKPLTSAELENLSPVSVIYPIPNSVEQTPSSKQAEAQPTSPRRRRRFRGKRPQRGETAIPQNSSQYGKHRHD